MRRFWIVAAFLGAVGSGAAGMALQEVTITAPTPYVPGQEGRHGDRDYGPPRVVDLDNIDFHPESYQRAHVIVVGTLNPLGSGEYLTLKDTGAQVLVIPGHEVTLGDLSPLVGRRVEIRGILRRIRKKEYVHGQDLDLVEDPTLPVLPEIDFKLPRNSITVLGLLERDTSTRGPAVIPAAAIVRDILDDPVAHADKKVRLVGLFRVGTSSPTCPRRASAPRATGCSRTGTRRCGSRAKTRAARAGPSTPATRATPSASWPSRASPRS